MATDYIFGCPNRNLTTALGSKMPVYQVLYTG